MRGLAAQTVRPAKSLRPPAVKRPVVVDRVVGLQPEPTAQLVVLLAVAGGDVDEARPRVLET